MATLLIMMAAVLTTWGCALAAKMTGASGKNEPLNPGDEHTLITTGAAQPRPANDDQYDVQGARSF